MGDNLITKKGIAKLKRELGELIEKRPEVASRLKEAAALGDISENSEFVAAKDYQAFVEGRIMEIENTLRNARLVQPGYRRVLRQVELGCAVVLVSAGRQKKFRIVGIGEGDPLKSEISSDSPIAQAILGKNIGDIVSVSTPAGNRKYKVVRIA